MEFLGEFGRPIFKLTHYSNCSPPAVPIHWAAMKTLGCLLIASLAGISGLLCVAAQTTAPETASIEGVVLDAATGKPIAGVNVWGPPKNPLDLPIQAQRQSTTTSGDGHFLLEKLEAGRLLLYSFKSGYMDRTFLVTTTVEQRVTAVTVRLTPTGVIAGVVFDSRGKPLLKARVRAFTTYDREGRSASVFASTNDKGEFRIVDLPPNRYLVAIEKPDQPRYITLPGQTVPRALDFGPNLLTQPENWDSPDPDASGMRSTLYPGVSLVSKAEAIEIKGGDVAALKPVVLTLSGLGSVGIRLVNGPGEGAKDMDLSLSESTMDVGITNGMTSLGGGGGRKTSTTAHLDPGGVFLKTYWPPVPGPFDLNVAWTDASGAKIEQKTFVKFDGSDTDLELVVGKPSGRVSIHVIQKQFDGKETPLSEAGVGACQVGSPCLWWNLNKDGQAGVTAIPEGLYSIDAVSRMTPTSYIAMARQGERDVLAQGLSVTPDSPPLEIRMNLTAGTLRGKVVDARGVAAPDALVGLLPDPMQEGNALFRRTVRTDQVGIYEFERVRPGKYRAFASLRKGWWFSESTFLVDREFVAQNWDHATPVQIKDNDQTSVELALP